MQVTKLSIPDVVLFEPKVFGDDRARLFPVPVSLMKLAGRVTGKTATVNRLMGSLTVDSSKIRRELGWVPPFTMDEGLAETAKWFKNK